MILHIVVDAMVVHLSVCQQKKKQICITTLLQKQENYEFYFQN